ncbi:phage head closure protein [Brevundimonas sp. TWP2-3-4b1]|uniref:phage head closure protein n=1 Tax=Brevundimonas sp. TWP2-3-4b1 TaxID=2804580 RepID=UPI003CE804D8
MRAGSLDRRIVLQRFTETRDEYNEPVLAWATLATRWASYEPIRDGEKFSASETAASLSARFVIRHSSAVADLNPKDRLTFESVVHQILNVKPIGRREGIEITTAARAD